MSPLRLVDVTAQLSVSQTEVQPCALGILASKVESLDSSGVIWAKCADLGTAISVCHHLERIGQICLRKVLSVIPADGASGWTQLAACVGTQVSSGDPVELGVDLERRAAGSVLILVASAQQTEWDCEILASLARSSVRTLYVILSAFSGPGSTLPAGVAELQIDGMAPQEIRSWWQTLSEHGHSLSCHAGLAELEQWWAAARVAKGSSYLGAIDALGQDARELLARIVLVQGPWSQKDLPALGEERALRELVNAGLVTCTDGWILLRERLVQPEISPERAAIVAAAVERCAARHDPWMMARAAVLHAQAGLVQRAEAVFSKALGYVPGLLGRRELWRMWRDAITGMPEQPRRQCALRAADMALEAGDADLGLQLAETAAQTSGILDFSALWVLGRAQLARGDTVAARVSLDRAVQTSATPEERALALAELGEVAYAIGDLDAAERFAADALATGTTFPVRLRARNTQGKLLLARAQWLKAEEHFAADECEAASMQHELGKLRARVNRAIALLSRGRLDDAEAMLDEVLSDATRQNELRAVAFALSNLAVLATDRHDYMSALRLFERAIDVRRLQGDKIGLARLVTNLAELRLRLGLVAEAEQALAFGRQTLRSGMPPTRGAHYALVAARIHLARENTLEAGRDISTAIASAAGSSDGAMTGECYRVATRIALEDGDLVRAAEMLRRSAEHNDSPLADAENALLTGMLSRAKGQNFAAAAASALALSRQADDEDLVCEALILCAIGARLDERFDDARVNLQAASRLVDDAAQSLPEPVRRRFLARVELRALAQELEALGRCEPIEPAAPPNTLRSPAAQHVGHARTIAKFVGNHPSVRRLLAVVQKVAMTSAPVLIQGESGTGKEIIAEALHACSDRRNGPLIKVNCSALVETLLLSELFGHEKGAFTGAASRRRGRFELADGGVLFLDEIGDISARTQVALLRVLQDQSFERVGGNSTLRTNVRVVCATHRDLKAMVASGAFREDLYYRLCGITLQVPALRNRVDDVQMLSAHLLGQIALERGGQACQLSAPALAMLQRYSWPGNVRELDNVLRASSLFCEQGVIGTEEVSEQLSTLSPESSQRLDAVARDSHAGPTFVPPDSATDTCSVAYQEIRDSRTSLTDLKRQIERECIQRALTETCGNITRAAALLGMKRPRLSQLVKQYGIMDVISEEC